MSAGRWLIGCILFASSGGCAVLASELDTRELGSAQRASTADTSSSDSNRDAAASSGGDALIGGNRDGGGPSQANKGNGGGRDDAHDSGDGSPPRRVDLGWQSLLPGSIQ